VLNADDPRVSAFAERAPGRVLWFGWQGMGYKGQGAGVFWEGDSLVWYPREDEGIVLVSVKELRVPGTHNRLNGCCAAQLALAAGVPVDDVRDGLRAFRGVADRLERTATVDGVEFYNDTTATAPAATLAALDALPNPLILIAGGADKRLDFSELAPIVAARCRGVVLLEGTATPALTGALTDAGASILGREDDFESAVRLAFASAEPGDAVLLSPACASFGMFANEFDRGAQFRHIVEKLAEEKRGAA